ncbi:Fc.00g107810.m01.CDS01 [Cosmosporella sp. VM-42]
MAEGDIMRSGLAYYRGDDCLTITPKFLHRWERILSTYPPEDLQLLPGHVQEAGRLHVMEYSAVEDPVSQLLDLDEDDEDMEVDSMQPLYLDHSGKFSLKGLDYRDYPFNEVNRNLNFGLKMDRWLQDSKSRRSYVGARTWFRDWSLNVWDFISSQVVLPILAMLLSASYGSAHLVAWNWDFPSEVECLFWQLSGIYIAAVFPLYWGYNKAMMTSASFIRSQFNVVRPRDNNILLIGSLFPFTSRCAELLWGFLNFYATTLYILARIYIIAEAFASLRRVPVGVYVSPSWLQTFPHV